MITRFIFDLDGTLCDSNPTWRAETSHITDYSDTSQTEPALDVMRRHYATDIRLKAGVMDFLRKARARGIRCCIATATRKDVAMPLVTRSGLAEVTEFLVDCDDAGSYKDRPDIYLLAAERLGAPPEECAVFEDSAPCARTAKRAGFLTVGVFDAVSVTEGDVPAECDIYLNSAADFFEAAEKNGISVLP